MTLAQEVATHLPLLRRYARALTGSQKSGDRYVGLLLETIVADPNTVSGSKNLRTALYRTLSRLWSSVSINLKPGGGGREDWEATASERLAAIAPRPRQAFVLTAVEGFSLDEAAEVLDAEPSEVTELLAQASRDIGEEIRTNVLIIEDEPLIAMDIESLVVSLGHRVTAIARTFNEALAAFKKERPGMVLADIQLADGSSGIDAVNAMLQTATVPVIFITAYPEALLTGERPEPAFLVTKPFIPEMVQAIISQALFFQAPAKTA
jgi:CheY-like chemotaxis protein/DNA-directed RNA polymerase specialized sigma24 family protein